ncbi:hypothetical protein [Candidatus Leptofilum sp.]|uniref:hypothetical protein n=1 Tax=Candidatus Leptofilum sp. TaxID=3241576 RepID=UPI003B5AD822
MIEARVVLTEAIVLQGFMLHFKYRQRFLRILPLLGGLMVLFAMINMFQGSPIITLMPALLPGLFLVALPLILQQLAKRNASRVPMLGQEIVWQLNKQGLAGTSPAREFTKAWTKLDDALITDEGILLYAQRAVSHWLPMAAFATEADFQQAKQLVQTGVKHHQIV